MKSFPATLEHCIQWARDKVCLQYCIKKMYCSEHKKVTNGHIFFLCTQDHIYTKPHVLLLTFSELTGFLKIYSFFFLCYWKGDNRSLPSDSDLKTYLSWYRFHFVALELSCPITLFVLHDTGKNNSVAMNCSFLLSFSICCPRIILSDLLVYLIWQRTK